MLKLYLCLLVFSISCYADNIVTVNSSENNFNISLKINQSTGYGWYLADYNSQLITPIKTEIFSINNKQIENAFGLAKKNFNNDLISKELVGFYTANAAEIL